MRLSFMLGLICTVSNGRVNVSNNIRVLPNHTSSYVTQLATQFQGFTVWSSARTNVSNSVRQFTPCCWKSQFLRERDGILLLQTVMFQTVHSLCRPFNQITTTINDITSWSNSSQFMLWSLISDLIISSLIRLAFRSTVSAIINYICTTGADRCWHSTQPHQSPAVSTSIY